MGSRLGVNPAHRRGEKDFRFHVAERRRQSLVAGGLAAPDKRRAKP